MCSEVLWVCSAQAYLDLVLFFLSMGMIMPVWKNAGKHDLDKITVNNDNSKNNSCLDLP